MCFSVFPKNRRQESQAILFEPTEGTEPVKKKKKNKKEQAE